MALRFLDVHLYRSTLNILAEGAAQAVQAAAEAGGGVLRCFPSFVGRKFCLPGKNLELADEDYFPEGPGGWAIDERWNGSAILADTGNGIHGEGLCHFHHPDGFLIPMDAAVHGRRPSWWGRCTAPWAARGSTTKFDNLYPLGHHSHPWKPGAYNFNAWRNNCQETRSLAAGAATTGSKDHKRPLKRRKPSAVRETRKTPPSSNGILSTLRCFRRRFAAAQTQIHALPCTIGVDLAFSLVPQAMG